ncbi:MAG TPA: hypothetical protein VGB52_15415 [Actinomycetota bacterium]
MTIADLRCDVCGTGLAGSAMLVPDDPRSAIRLFVHPGDPLHREDSILVCQGCWRGLLAWMGEQGRADACAACGVPVSYEGSLHVLVMTGRIGEAPEWQLCRAHAVELLNRFRFTDPKMRIEDLALKADFTAR